MAGHGYHPYWARMGQLFAGLPSRNSAFGPAMLVETDQIFDFLQAATIKHLARDVQGAWDGQTVRLPAVYGVHPGGKYILGTTTPSETLQAADIQKALSDNHYVELLEHEILQVPPGTKLVSKGVGSDKHLVLDANGFKVTIGTVGWSGATLGLPLWGIIDPPVDEPTRYEIQQYTVMVMAETPWLRRYMAGIESYWKWVANINERFEEIDWKTIDAAMIDQSRRGAYPNVLEQVIERYTRPTP